MRSQPLIDINAIPARPSYLDDQDPLNGPRFQGGSAMLETTLSFPTIIPLAAVVATGVIFAVLWMNSLIRH
jgi:hypothetical protein